jgi:hypothetical protein
MNTDPVRVHRVEFRSALPALRLFDALPLACYWKLIVIAFVAVLLNSAVDSWLRSARTQPVSVVEPGLQHRLQAVLPDVVAGGWQELSSLLIAGWRAGGLTISRLLLRVLLLGFCGALAFHAQRRHRLIAGSVRPASISFRRVELVRHVLIDCGLMVSICSGAWMLFRIHVLVLQSMMPPDAHPAGFARFVAEPVGLMLAITALLLLLVAGTGWLLSLAGIGLDHHSGASALSGGISFVLSRVRYTCALLAASLVLLMATSQLMRFSLAYVGGLGGEAMIQTELSTRADAAADDHAGHVAGTPASAVRARREEFPPHYDLHSPVTLTLLETWKLSVFLSTIALSYLLLRQSVDGVPFEDGAASAGGTSP